MRPLAALAEDTARALSGVVFDLDGTLLSGGVLTLDAYRALFRLRDAGLRLVACTGRPAGWGAVIARHWPIDLAVTENGALGFARHGARVAKIDPLDAAARNANAGKLAEAVAAMRAVLPDVPLADDNDLRVTDRTFDVGEVGRQPRESIEALKALALAHGARVFESSIHLHVTFERDDKASGTVRALCAVLGDDPSAAAGRWAFVGDSGNDEACFSAFRVTFGVANVRAWLPRLSVPPRYVAEASEGAGFAEIAERLVALRGS